MQQENFLLHFFPPLSFRLTLLLYACTRWWLYKLDIWDLEEEKILFFIYNEPDLPLGPSGP